MKVLKTGIMPNGTHIQIEEWNENYSFMPYGSTIASYPKSKMSHDGAFSPKGNQVYRFDFNFESEQETKCIFDSLLNGEKGLADIKTNLNRKEYADCI
jgi:hypothetical protein